MGFISGLGLKGWAIIAIILGVLGFLGKYEYDEHQLRQAGKTIVKQAVVIADQKDTIKTGAVVAEVKDEVHDAVNKGVEKIADQHQTVVKKLVQKEKVIDQTFDKLPETADNVIAKAQEISTARIDSMWELYCNNAPDSTECKINQPQGESHAQI